MPPRRAPPPPPPPGGLTLRTGAACLAISAALTAGLVAWAARARAQTVARAGAACSAAAGAAVETALGSLLVGRRDLALASSGGRVLGHSALVGGGTGLHPQADQLLLTPPPGGVALPGRCLPLAGPSGGWVELALRTPAPASPTSPHDTRDAQPPPPFFVTSVTLEAPPPALSFSEGKAALPSILSVSLATGKESDGAWQWTHAGEARYDSSAVAVGSVARLAQTSKLAAPGPARVVRLAVVANGGHEGGTCLYRVRVHGEE